MRLSKKAEIEGFLARPPKGVCGALLYGRDRSQVLDRAASLARVITSDINDPFNVALLTESDLESDVVRLEDELQAMSLMGGRRLVRLKFFSEKAALEKTVAAIVKQHASRAFNPETFLIIEAGGLGADSSLRKVAEGEAALGAVPCYDDETGDIVRMARDALSKNEVSLSMAAMDIFTQRLPKERGIAQQEIERLVLFIGPGTRRTLDEVELIDFLGVEPEASLFKAAQDAFGGRMKQAQSGLRRAFAEGESGVDALRALGQHLSRLRAVKSALDTGASLKEAARNAGIFWKDEDEFGRQTRSWRADALDGLSGDLIEADKKCKTTGMPDQLLSERLYMQIAGRAGRSGL